MSDKGISQVDFAVATSLLIVVFVFTVSHVSGYYSNAMQVIQTSELRTRAFNLEKTAFEQKGVPAYWHWKGKTTRPSAGTTIWKAPIHLEEYNGTSGTWEVKVTLDPGTTYGVPNAWNESVKVYHDGSPIPTEVETTSMGFLSEFDLVFEVEVDANKEETVYAYYSQDNLTSATYASLTEDTDITLNVTVLSEGEVEGLTPYKLKKLDNMSLIEMKEKYDFHRNFNLTLYDGSEILYSYGLKVPEGVSVELYSNKIRYQNETGHVKLAKGTATVW